MIQNTQTSFQAGPAVEFFSQAAQAATDYSAKAAARQVAFFRALGEKNRQFSWQTADASAVEESAKDCAKECAAYVRESLGDFAQAADSNCDAWERAMTGFVEQSEAAFNMPQTDVGRRWLDNVKTANAAVKNGVRAACRAAVPGDSLEINAEEAAKTAKPAGRKNGKR